MYNTNSILDLVYGERIVQTGRFGAERQLVNEATEKTGIYGWDGYINRKLAILTEEVGEVARAINERDPDNLRDELIQVAAVAVAMIEGLDGYKEACVASNQLKLEV